MYRVLTAAELVRKYLEKEDRTVLVHLKLCLDAMQSPLAAGLDIYGSTFDNRRVLEEAGGVGMAFDGGEPSWYLEKRGT